MIALLAVAGCTPPPVPSPPSAPAAPVTRPVPSPAASSAKPPPSLEGLAWMLGRWRFVEANRVHEELWFRHGSTVWLGFNRTTKNGRLHSHELLRLDGTASPIRYIAAPVKQAVTSFALTELTPRQARFTHPRHDPGWVRYVRRDDRMTASVGPNASDEAHATWQFQRVGDAATREIDLHLCRTQAGDAVRMILPPAGAGAGSCRAELLCRAFETTDGVDLHVAYLTSPATSPATSPLTSRACDDRDPVIGSCAAPAGELSIHGRPLTLDEAGCAELRVPVLHVADS